MSAFAFESVSKVFTARGGTPVAALRDFSVVGEEKAITCLLGPTGCGKTTALRLAAGLEDVDAGRVAVGGKRPNEQRTRIGYLPQRHTLFPWLRLEENVLLPVQFTHSLDRRARVAARAALEEIGLEGRERAYPHECSGGMQQRAMLARQLVSGARYWLMDEPFAALDERTRHRLQRLLLSLRAERELAVLFVTPSIEEAVFLADRIAVLPLTPGGAVKRIAVDRSHPRDRLAPWFSEQVETIRCGLEKLLREEDQSA